MKSLKRALLLVLAAAMLLAAGLPAFSTGESLPTLFVNDEPWYNESAYPRYDIYSEYYLSTAVYLPVTMFTALEGITSILKETPTLRNLILSRGEKYLTFDLDKSLVYTAEGEQISIDTFLLYRDVRYVPARLVCEYFGLRYETTPGGEAVRIGDDRAALSFEQVLSRYHPALVPGETTEIIPAEPTLPEGTPRSVYFLFLQPWEDEDAFESLCLLLAEHSAAAVFVCSDVAGHPETVRTACAYGHRIALRAPAGDPMPVLQAENEALCRLTKRKTRLVWSEKNLKTTLKDSGYVQCRPDSLGEEILSLSDPFARVEKALSRSTAVYLALPCSRPSVRLVEQVLQAVSEDKSCSVGIITDSEWL